MSGPEADLPPLSAADFPAFFRAAQRWTDEAGFSPARFNPFPWQARLAETVATTGWPAVLDLPTGSGKTAAIDVAVFHLALEADAGVGRMAAMRIAFVVDRRLVVDDAYARARRLAGALKAALDAPPPEGGGDMAVLKAAAARLRSLAGPGEDPLVVRRLRGGVPREPDWALRACQPTVLCSTVDQVGSRMLFRAYGMSERAAPMQAGLLGSDCRVLLDEAHLSEPFRQTVQDIGGVTTVNGGDTRAVRLTLLSATTGEPGFGLEPEDWTDETLGKRLRAAKPAKLTTVADQEDERAQQTAGEARKLLTELASKLEQDPGHTCKQPAIGVICNRVARARAVFNMLKDDPDVEVLLLIGPSRSVDRGKVEKKLAPIRTGAGRALERPLIVVSTQTLEVGVDIDLDGLVTDAAALDALRQRFGRLNRGGRHHHARAVILAGKAERKADPIYGAAIGLTLKLLFPDDKTEPDFSVAAMGPRLAQLAADDAAAATALMTPRTDAPVLMPAYAELWAQTAPAPACDPDVALFLHGPRGTPASVTVVWRADLPLGGVERQDEVLREALALAPPQAAEGISLPVWAVRRWLSWSPTPELADVAAGEPEAAGGGAFRHVFRWAGDNDGSRTLTRPGEIRPGDTLVAPASYGGCDKFGWDPTSEAPVTDRYVQAVVARHTRATVKDGKAAQDPDYAAAALRLSEALIGEALEAQRIGELSPSDATAGSGTAEGAGDELTEDERDAAADELARRTHDAFEQVAAAVAAAGDAPTTRKLLPALAQLELPDALGEHVAALNTAWRRAAPVVVLRNSEDEVLAVVVPAARGRKRAPSTEDDGGSFEGVEQALAPHGVAVEAEARAQGVRAGFTPAMVDDLALAGFGHDFGKLDPRFQDVLGAQRDEHGAVPTPLAKSKAGRSPPGAYAALGLPPGWRHEAASVRLMLEHPRLAEAHDRALVLWLIGTHHGLGRPFFGFVEEEEEGQEPGPEQLGWVIPEDDRFGPTARDARDLRGLDWFTLARDLRERYGPWRLALLEATLRLADHRASAAARARDEGGAG